MASLTEEVSTNSENVPVRDVDIHSADEDFEPEEISNEWPLNTLIVKLAKNTTEGELEILKALCRGNGGIARGTLEKIKTPIQFFDALRIQGCLDSNNLIYLQGFIWYTGNMENFHMIVDYARQMQRIPLHFFPGTKHPENGFSSVKFHVAGRETSRWHVEKIRSTVAYILQLSGGFVIWKGAQPFESIVLTFMIPEDAVKNLLNLTMEEKGYLLELNIDKFIIDDGQDYLLKHHDFATPKVLSETDEINRLLNKNKYLETKLEQMEIKCLEMAKQYRTATHTSTKEITTIYEGIGYLEGKFHQNNEEILKRLKEQRYFLCT